MHALYYETHLKSSCALYFGMEGAQFLWWYYYQFFMMIVTKWCYISNRRISVSQPPLDFFFLRGTTVRLLKVVKIKVSIKQSISQQQSSYYQLKTSKPKPYKNKYYSTPCKKKKKLLYSTTPLHCSSSDQCWLVFSPIFWWRLFSEDTWSHDCINQNRIGKKKEKKKTIYW